MQPVEVGFISILPPLVAIILALITKEVISSLLLGILSGVFIYSINAYGGVSDVIDITVKLMAKNIAEHAYVVIFIAMLGVLVKVVTKAGGSRAYGEWSLKKIKSRKGTQLATCILGMIIAIDDYFSCLTTSNVMRPVSDGHKISRAKLAYIIDSSAAPICIMMPISSWAASVISCLNEAGLNGTSDFINTVFYNIYAILTIIMVVFLSLSGKEFGPMAAEEEKAQESNEIFNEEISNIGEEGEIISKNGTVFDLLVPILTLIISSLFFMLKIGNFFKGNVSFSEAIAKTDAPLSIALGVMMSIFVAFIMFVPRKLLSYSDFVHCINEGIKSMAPSFVILILAWTIGDVCKDLLGTGIYLGNVVSSSNIPTVFLPFLIFCLSGVLAFATGTSWGTFGILIPIVVFICRTVAPEIMTIALSSTLAGAVFGDHCSPISDTTALSALGSKCDHMLHASTQLPYAALVAVVSAIGYLILGISKSIILTLPVCICLLIGSILILNKIWRPRSK